MVDIDPNGPYDPEENGALDFEDMVVVLDTGERVPISNMVDGTGEPTEDPVDAVSLVAGPTKSGQWLVFAVTDEDLRTSGLIE